MEIRMNRRMPNLFILLLFFPALVLAQTASTGALGGTITDSAGAVVPGAQIKVTNEGTGETRTVVSQANGNYTVPLLPPGSYRMGFSKTGFKSAVKVGLEVNVTETARLDVQLETGNIQEQVTVTSDAQLLQTESSALGRVTDRMLVSNLPLVTRNYTQIVTLSPGIAAGVTNASQLGRGTSGESGGEFRAHGGFGRDNNFQMNGVQINDLQASGFFSGGVAVPNPDTIQEFKVQTGLYDATYGRNSGANVNVVTRSGANEFHGTVFEFFRNDALNANEFFRNRNNQPRGVLKQNQFGFTLGGPIKQNRLLFFGSYQGMRQRNGIGGGGATSFFSPPFTNDRSRAALGQMFGGRAGMLGGVAVAADGFNISAPALALLNLKHPNGEYVIPSPQQLDPTREFDVRGFSALSIPARFDEDQFLVNIDLLHTDKSKIEGRFFFADSKQNQPFASAGPPGFPLLTDNEMRNLSLSHKYTFSANLINQADLGFHRIFVPTIQQELFQFSDIGVNAPSNANPYPLIAIQGAFILGGGGQGLETGQNHFTFQDSLTYVRGRHTLRLGGGFTHTQLNITNFHSFGGLTFLSWPDFLLGLPGGPITAGGNGTMFSNIFQSQDIPGLFDRMWRINDGNLYVQDDIKLASSFTLNFGVRYERLGQMGDKLGRNGGFDPALANLNPPAGGTLEGFVVSKNFQGTIPAGVTQLDNTFGVRGEHMNNIGPRIGFAWRLPRTVLPFTERMALRGGYGIYYSRSTGQPFIQLIASPPFAVGRQLQGPLNATASFVNPFQPEQTLPQFTPYSPTTLLIVPFLDPGYRPPVTQQYSLNLQTDLGRDLLLEVGYVGTKGTHQIITRSLNQARLASAANTIRGETTNTVTNIRRRVPYQGFTPNGVSDIDSSGTFRYDGLEVSLTKRLSKGLQFLASYTFAHVYTISANNTGASGGTLTGDQTDLRANYGRPDFNREHRLVLSYVYQLPGLKKSNAFFNGLLSGWAVSGVTVFQSGAPLSLTGANVNNVFGITTNRAQLAAGCTYDDLTTSGSVHSKLNNYFNRSCTANWPIIGDDGRATNFGNSGVGIVFGPDQRNFDLALIKRTPLGGLREGVNIEFRAEFFNAFNTTQFANPNTTATTANFGLISGTTVNPRIVQLALKLNF
jgi:Carboxypeptidase regulatory-like domain